MWTFIVIEPALLFSFHSSYITQRVSGEGNKIGRVRLCVMFDSTLKALIRSTQSCIPPGSLNRVPSAGVRAGMSPLPGRR